MRREKVPSPFLKSYIEARDLMLMGHWIVLIFVSSLWSWSTAEKGFP